MVEGGAPNALMRNGWNRNSVPAGTKVHVEGFQAKDRSFRASGREITLPDGKSLFMGQGGAAGDGQGKAPVNQAFDAMLGAALQLPAMKKLGEELGMNFDEGLAGVLTDPAPKAAPHP